MLAEWELGHGDCSGVKEDKGDQLYVLWQSTTSIHHYIVQMRP